MIPYSTQCIEKDDIAAVERVLQSSHLTQGNEVSRFEEEIATYIGVQDVVVFNSATSALLALYEALGFKEGDEVVTTPISFVATTNMFVRLGAKPIWCDVRLDGNIDETKIEAVITPATKAIVAVDFGGKSVEQEKIVAIAKRHGLWYIDDACHAFGGEYKGRKIGTFADASVFSFHAIKPITTTEGGCVVTDDMALAEALRLIRSHGVRKGPGYTSDMVRMGYNMRMSDVAAALGRSQLKKVDRFLARRNEIAAYYDERFSDSRLFSIQKIPSHIYSSRHLYPLILKSELHSQKENIFTKFQERGLGVQVHYKPIYRNSFYKERFGEFSLPTSNDFYKSEISIPCHQAMSIKEATHVADTVLEVLEQYSYRRCSF